MQRLAENFWHPILNIIPPDSQMRRPVEDLISSLTANYYAANTDIDYLGAQKIYLYHCVSAIEQRNPNLLYNCKNTIKEHCVHKIDIVQILKYQLIGFAILVFLNILVLFPVLPIIITVLAYIALLFIDILPLYVLMRNLVLTWWAKSKVEQMYSKLLPLCNQNPNQAGNQHQHEYINRNAEDFYNNLYNNLDNNARFEPRNEQELAAKIVANSFAEAASADYGFVMKAIRKYYTEKEITIDDVVINRLLNTLVIMQANDARGTALRGFLCQKTVNNLKKQDILDQLNQPENNLVTNIPAAASTDTSASSSQPAIVSAANSSSSLASSEQQPSPVSPAPTTSAKIESKNSYSSLFNGQGKLQVHKYLKVHGYFETNKELEQQSLTRASVDDAQYPEFVQEILNSNTSFA